VKDRLIGSRRAISPQLNIWGSLRQHAVAPSARDEADATSVEAMKAAPHSSTEGSRDGMRFGQDSDGNRWTTFRWQGRETTTV
jgi:hypothetical protein